MTNQEAIKLIQDRTEELVNDVNVRAKMVNLKREGKSQQEIQGWIVQLAIGTLYGG